MGLGPGGHRHPSLGQLPRPADHRHAPLPAPRHDLGWVAQRNNTWSLHLHIGIRGADRAIAVCDWLRELLPLLLAASANSPFLDRRDTGLHIVRTEIFTRTFPRCGIPERFRQLGRVRATSSPRWSGSARSSSPPSSGGACGPHHRFGTVEVRICDAQTRGDESFALAGADRRLHRADRARLRRARLRRRRSPLLDREIEENLWRAIRYGMDGEMIDFRRGGRSRGARGARGVLAWTAPAREHLGIEVALPEANGAQRARAALAEGATIEEIYREAVAETGATYGVGSAVR